MPDLKAGAGRRDITPYPEEFGGQVALAARLQRGGRRESTQQQRPLPQTIESRANEE